MRRISRSENHAEFSIGTFQAGPVTGRAERTSSLSARLGRQNVQLLVTVGLCALLAVPCLALEVYVNNKPFEGAVAGHPSNLNVDAAAFFKLVGGDYQVSDEGGVTFNGEKLETTVVNGVRLVSARQIVDKVGGKYSYSPELDVLDIYAFDPIGSAREQLQRVLKLPKITRAQDFLPLSVLARHTLVVELGLGFDPPIKRIDLVSAQTFAQEGGPAGTNAFAKPLASAGEKLYDFIVVEDNTPFETIRVLGWLWGATWAADQGVRDAAVMRGFGEWTSYKLLSALTGKMSPETVFSATDAYDAPAAAIGRELVSVENEGGIPAVIAHIRER